MIKHIVTWKLKESAGGRNKEANARLLKERLEALRGCVPGLIKIEVGQDFSRTPFSGDLVLYSEFVSREALAAYQIHPEHEAVKAFVLDVSEERRLVDYEV